MAKEFRVQISTPNKVYLDKEAICVTIPTAKGYVGVLHKHAPIVGALEPGYMYINLSNGEKLVALVNYGMYIFKNNKLTLLSDFFEFNKGVNENAIEQIAKKINEESNKIKLSDHAIHALNSYMKLVSIKAKQKK